MNHAVANYGTYVLNLQSIHGGNNGLLSLLIVKEIISLLNLVGEILQDNDDSVWRLSWSSVKGSLPSMNPYRVQGAIINSFICTVLKYKENGFNKVFETLSDLEMDKSERNNNCNDFVKEHKKWLESYNDGENGSIDSKYIY